MNKGLRFSLMMGAVLVMATQQRASACSPAAGAISPSVQLCPDIRFSPAVQYVEQKVTAYKCVAKEREVECVVSKMVSEKEVNYKYTVNEMVTTPEKRMVTTYDCVPVEKTFKRTCMEMVTVAGKTQGHHRAGDP